MNKPQSGRLNYATIFLLSLVEFLRSGMKAFAAAPILGETGIGPEEFSLIAAVYASLSDAEWQAMMGRIEQIAQIAQDEFDVKSYLHPHAGCYIEFEDEVDRAMKDLSPDLVGLCVDTGHSAYAGIDPVKLIERYASRIGHMHFKNIDRAVHAQCIAEGVISSARSRVACSARWVTA